ncbi:hypothetical protein [Bacillus sp. B15-48]|uniref:hypothetical protein n=1 Tax=Bacillus sp. B15-48 TaxID=1548601 RepID=UPI00193F133B|nr:hypothetical protein [Bacillus sp. B15-48]MBM4762132.1 hypothetical protein [Bacillus sp. B15-48]
MYNLKWLLLSFMLMFLLTGCMYPAENLAQNKIPYQDQLDSVQNAVKKYQEDNNGILPIKTKDAETPIYQKYLVDFKKIVPSYISAVPGNAFENGGIFQYVLIDVETTPTVKLLDLRVADTIRDIKMRLQVNEYPPFKGQVSKNVFTLDFSKLGFSQDPVAVSPFTGGNLPYVISGDGEIYVDYRSDLYQKLREKDNNNLKHGDDIRSILTDDSMFVPAYSLPYTVDADNGEPIFLDY